MSEPCTQTSHARDKRALAATLVHGGEQLDDDGKVEIIYLHCLLCASTLAIEPAYYAARYQELAA
jgi:hypothetical protein